MLCGLTLAVLASCLSLSSTRPSEENEFAQPIKIGLHTFGDWKLKPLVKVIKADIPSDGGEVQYEIDLGDDDDDDDDSDSGSDFFEIDTESSEASQESYSTKQPEQNLPRVAATTVRPAHKNYMRPSPSLGFGRENTQVITDSRGNKLRTNAFDVASKWVAQKFSVDNSRIETKPGRMQLGAVQSILPQTLPAPEKPYRRDPLPDFGYPPMQRQTEEPAQPYQRPKPPSQADKFPRPEFNPPTPHPPIPFGGNQILSDTESSDIHGDKSLKLSIDHNRAQSMYEKEQQQAAGLIGRFSAPPPHLAGQQYGDPMLQRENNPLAMYGIGEDGEQDDSIYQQSINRNREMAQQKGQQFGMNSFGSSLPGMSQDQMVPDFFDLMQMGEHSPNNNEEVVKNPNKVENMIDDVQNIVSDQAGTLIDKSSGSEQHLGQKVLDALLQPVPEPDGSTTPKEETERTAESSPNVVSGLLSLPYGGQQNGLPGMYSFTEPGNFGSAPNNDFYATGNLQKAVPGTGQTVTTVYTPEFYQAFGDRFPVQNIGKKTAKPAVEEDTPAETGGFFSDDTEQQNITDSFQTSEAPTPTLDLTNTGTGPQEFVDPLANTGAWPPTNYQPNPYSAMGSLPPNPYTQQQPSLNPYQQLNAKQYDPYASNNQLGYNANPQQSLYNAYGVGQSGGFSAPAQQETTQYEYNPWAGQMPYGYAQQQQYLPQQSQFTPNSASNDPPQSDQSQNNQFSAQARNFIPSTNSQYPYNQQTQYPSPYSDPYQVQYPQQYQQPYPQQQQQPNPQGPTQKFAFMPQSNSMPNYQFPTHLFDPSSLALPGFMTGQHQHTAAIDGPKMPDPDNFGTPKKDTTEEKEDENIKETQLPESKLKLLFAEMDEQAQLEKQEEEEKPLYTMSGIAAI